MILSGGADDTIRLFSLSEDGTQILPGLIQPCAHASDVNCVAWHPSDPSVFLSAGDDGKVKLWKLK